MRSFLPGGKSEQTQLEVAPAETPSYDVADAPDVMTVPTAEGYITVPRGMGRVSLRMRARDGSELELDIEP